MQRWIATILMLVVPVPSLGPLALAGTAQTGAAHCVRPMLHEHAAEAAVGHCHHGATVPEPSPSETSFHAIDFCCANHDCCRGLKTSEWARPTLNALSETGRRVEIATQLPVPTHISADLPEQDSARAPPRC